MDSLRRYTKIMLILLGSLSSCAKAADFNDIVSDDPRPNAVELMSEDDIRKMMVEESINNYGGECPCPFSPNSIGDQCGTFSAYYRTKAEPLFCYMVDISQRDIYLYRFQHTVPAIQLPS